MSYTEHEIEKLYWTFPEVCKELNLKPGTVRHYSIELGITRDFTYRGQARRFTREEIEALKQFIHLKTLGLNGTLSKRLIRTGNGEEAITFFKTVGQVKEHAA